MTAQPPGGSSPAPDLEYDLAHEAPETAVQHSREHPRSVRVNTRTSGDQGDYGYDLAHDTDPD